MTIERALDLNEHLPVSFNDPNEYEYVAFLWDAFEVNYTRGKYQFAFLAYHMLIMSFVYFKIWQIRAIYPGDFNKSIVSLDKETMKYLDKAQSPFSLYVLPEKATPRLFRFVGCCDDNIGVYESFVQTRNKCSSSQWKQTFQKPR